MLSALLMTCVNVPNSNESWGDEPDGRGSGMSEWKSWFDFVRSDAPTPVSWINEEIAPEPEPEPEPKSARQRADRRWHMHEERKEGRKGKC